MEIWFTDELEAVNSSRNGFKGIDGFMMEFTGEQRSATGIIKMKMTATKVEKVPVSDDLFKVPEGYTVTTMEEMRKQYQK